MFWGNAAVMLSLLLLGVDSVRLDYWFKQLPWLNGYPFTTWPCRLFWPELFQSSNQTYPINTCFLAWLALHDFHTCSIKHYHKIIIHLLQYHIITITLYLSIAISSWLLYFNRGGCGYGSESEGEEPADSRVTLPQNVPGRGNVKAQQSAIRLTEVLQIIYNYSVRATKLQHLIIHCLTVYFYLSLIYSCGTY